MTISERVAARFAAIPRVAKAKHPEVVKAVIDYFKTGPFKPYLKLKSARGGNIVLTVNSKAIGNSHVDRIDISNLNGDKAEYSIHNTDGTVGWGWDEYRKPPKFQNDPGYNILYLDRLEKYVGTPQFADHMTSFCKTLVASAQKVGFVFDPGTKRVVPIEAWEAAEKAKVEAAEKAEKARAEAEAAAKAREKAKNTPAPGYLYSQDTIDSIYSAVKYVVKRYDRGASGFSSEMEGKYLSVSFRLEEYDREWDNEYESQTKGLDERLRKRLNEIDPAPDYFLEEDEKGWYRALIQVKS
jgi:hypothetical protein